MHRLLTLMSACVISGGMALGQSAPTGQAPASGTQSSANSTSAAPNSNPQGQASSNPANASRDAQANGKAVRSNGANGGTPGTAAGSANNPPDNSDNNGMAKDDTGNNPASGRGPKTITNPGTAGTRQWFWIALAVIIAVALIAAIASRNRVTTNIDDRDPALRFSRDPDVIRRDDIARARRDDIDRDRIRRAS